MPIALITGASAGLGEQLARALAGRSWDLVLTARGADRLKAVAASLPGRITAIPGDVAEPAHRAALAEAAGPELALLVNNASELGPSPLVPLAQLDDIERIFRVNVFAALGLIRATLPALRAASGTVVDVSSDAAVEAYPGWGGYGSSKAALDQLSAVLGQEEPSLHVYAVDPGDLRTELHQRAFPGEDISDRPEPDTAVPGFLRLIDEQPRSGRYRIADLRAEVAAR